jgi:ABC-type branched-subunit amino acid transport system ATPase component/branched-subunit amino acid ABC-type transport system permease component
MKDLLPFVVIGITTGAVYGLTATGLVLTYKTSGIFNFAHGALATAAAYLFYWLRVDHHMAWPLAGFISVVVLGVVFGFGLERFARGLSGMTTALKIVGTIGLVLIVQGLATVKYGATARQFPGFLPRGTVRLVSVNVGYDQLIVTAVGLVAVSGLYVFFRVSRMGVAMRGVVDNADLLDLTGTSPAAVRRWSWVIGATFATLSGVLLAPSVNLDAILLTNLVIQGFGAAAIGYFSSLPLTYLGGTLIGVAVALSTKYVDRVSWLGGLSLGLPFIVLFAVLLVIPRRRLVTTSLVRVRAKQPWKAPPRVRLVAAVVILAVLLIIPSVVGTRITVYTNALTYVILLLSLGLLVRTSGQVSLCHMAFAAVGAAAFSHLAVGLGVPWLLAILAAGMITVPIGALVAIPAIRLSGLFLALATLGFGLLLEGVFYVRSFMFGATTTGLAMPRPKLGGLHLGTDTGYYYVVLAFVVLTAVAMVLIHEGRLGRLLRGMADSPLALATGGLSVNVTRVIVFCISAFVAGVAGALYGVLINTTSNGSFPSFTSITLLALVILAPFAEPWYPLVGGIGLAVIPSYIHGAKVTNWLNVFFGFSAVVVALTGGTQPAPGFVQRFFQRFGRRRESGDPSAPASLKVVTPHPAATVRQPAAGRTGLEVRDLSVRYGGIAAVQGLDLRAPTGRITGLIGPNGAGKTTTFNACSGLVRPSRGAVMLHGEDVSHLGAAARARHGLGRTFQRMELFDSLTVAQNVSLGREAAMAGASPLSQVIGKPGDRARLSEAVTEAVELAGIRPLLDQPAGSLSTGQRRLVELARCLAGPFDLLLLDEPSSGLDRSETQRFGRVLCEVVAQRGLGILLVEHDMSLVMDVCRHIYVLDFGVPIFEGSPAEVRASSEVRAAYLGADGADAHPVAAAESR